MTPPDNLKAKQFHVVDMPNGYQINGPGFTYYLHTPMAADILADKMNTAWNTRTPDPVIAKLVKYVKWVEHFGPDVGDGFMQVVRQEAIKILSHLEPETKGK